MTIPLARKFEGKKFMWDGKIYETEDQARQTLESYQQNGFEVQLFAEKDQYLVYSRRIVVEQSEANN